MPTVANTLRPGSWSLHRKVTGAPVAADPAASGSFPVRAGLLNCLGYQTIQFRPVLTAAGASDVDVQVLAYDAETDTFAVLQSFSNVANGVAKEATVHGQRVFLRITGAVGAPTVAELHCSGGQTDKHA